MVNQGSAGHQACATVSLPRTPHHIRSGAAIDKLIHKINDNWNLGLRVRPLDWSPSVKSDDPADKIYGKVKRLFFSNRASLNEALTTFEHLAPKYRDREGRLNLLLRILTEKSEQKISTTAHDLRNRLEAAAKGKFM